MQIEFNHYCDSPEWKNYVQLMEDRPALFQKGEDYEIQTALETVIPWMRDHQKKIGVVYKSPYSIMVVDLVKDRSGNLFAYERLLPAVQNPAVVCIPVFEDKFILLNQFRHSLRRLQLAFPRGFGEKGLSGEENAAKELSEELGCSVLSVKKIGSVVADSGLSGNEIQVFLCQTGQPEIKNGYEGIQSIIMLDSQEINKAVKDGKINDGFTLSALALMEAHS